MTGVFLVNYGGDTEFQLGIIKKQVKYMLVHEAPADIENWKQDEDVLDTWFSSALWPFSTMGWPDEEAKNSNVITQQMHS